MAAETRNAGAVGADTGHAGLTLLERQASDARAVVLTEAAACVLQDRNTSYGEPEDNFRRIADLWSVHLWNRGLLPRGTFLEPYDVAIMNGQIKEARLAQSPKKLDNWVDLAGYAACGYRAASR